MKLSLATTILCLLGLVAVQVHSQDCEIEESYFNFFINVENVIDDDKCDLEAIGEMAANVTDEIALLVPDYPSQGESLEADTCTTPLEKVRRLLFGLLRGTKQQHNDDRMLAKRKKKKRNKYVYGGVSACRRCKAKVERRLYEESVTEVCARAMEAAERKAALAYQACANAEQQQQQLRDYSKTKETIDHLEPNKIEKFVREGQKYVDECEMKKEPAIAASKVVDLACAQEATAKSDSEIQAFDYIALTLEELAEKEAKETENDFFKTKDSKMRLKEEVTKEIFERTKAEMEGELDVLGEDVDVEIEKLKTKMDELEIKQKEAKERGDFNKEQRIADELDELKDMAESLKDELKAIENEKKEKHGDEFDFAKGILDVEAANTMKDWYEEFADLIEMKLPDALEDEKFKECFDGEDPKVKVKVVAVEKEDTFSIDDCPSS